MLKKVAIEDFVDQEKESLTKFLFYWSIENKKDPVNFPKNLNLGEWGEQFQAFQDSVE